MNAKDIKKRNMLNFDKLDKNGFVKEGSYVTADDAIIDRISASFSLS